MLSNINSRVLPHLSKIKKTKFQGRMIHTTNTWMNTSTVISRQSKKGMRSKVKVRFKNIWSPTIVFHCPIFSYLNLRTMRHPLIPAAFNRLCWSQSKSSGVRIIMVWLALLWSLHTSKEWWLLLTKGDRIPSTITTLCHLQQEPSQHWTTCNSLTRKT